MPFNPKQIDFINHVQSTAINMISNYPATFDIAKRFTEQFKTGQPYSLSGSDTEMVANFGIKYDDLIDAINQAFVNYNNYITGVEVANRQYGKDLRNVSKIVQLG